MRVRVRYQHWIPRALRVEGIVVYPYVLFRQSRERTSVSTLQHEMIHVRQVRAHGFFSFYVRYAGEYLRGRLRKEGHDRAYRMISFEAEAYRDQGRVALSETERREIG